VAELRDVFGLNRYANPLSYVVRPIERRFISCLSDNSVVAIVIYGMSKQGKTSLLRHALPEKKHILAQGNRGIDTESIFRAILNKCGIRQEVSQTFGGRGDITAKIGEWFKVKLGAKGEMTREPVAIDIGNADSVAEVLANADDRRIIVIDNFHYINLETQSEISTAIRSFETHGFKFVIIGTWNEEGYLQSHNNDLSGTVREFSFDEWDFADLKSVLDKGLPLLNVSLTGPVRQSLIDRSLKNVALLQELTKDYLTLQRVDATCEPLREFSDVDGVTTVAQDLEERLFNDIVKLLLPVTHIGNPYVGGKSRSWWMLYAFLGGKHGDIVRGMAQDALYKVTTELASKKARELKVNPDDFTMADFMGLLRHHWHQEQTKNQKTPVLAYHDVNRSLVVVDAYTKFVLRTQELRSRMRAAI